MKQRRVDAGSPSFQVMLDRVKKVVQGALANADVPLQQVVSDLNVARSTSYTPVFQAAFSIDDVTFGAAAEALESQPSEVRGCFHCD